jgi:hypothetical protein
MGDIDEAPVGMQEADVALLAAQLVVDFLAVKQGAQHAQVLAELASLHRVLAHDTHRCVAGADAKEDAARRLLVDGGDRMRRHRRQPHAGHGDTSAQPNARGVGRRQGQHGIGVGIEHLRIGGPGRVVAHRLEVDEQFPVRDTGNDSHTELHGLALFSGRSGSVTAAECLAMCRFRRADYVVKLGGNRR